MAAKSSPSTQPAEKLGQIGGNPKLPKGTIYVTGTGYDLDSSGKVIGNNGKSPVSIKPYPNTVVKYGKK